jgi:ribosomal protein S18 acetylase RimI-like enzyme
MTTDSHITIQSAASIPKGDLVAALNGAYQDYFVPIYLTMPSFEQLVSREDLLLEHSGAALDGDNVVGMGLLGVRGKRAWIGGMGVIPAYRRKGIGRQLMDYLLAQARQIGIEQVQLEVITQNTGAHHLYEQMNFKMVRKLLLLFADPGKAPTGSPADGLTIQQDDPGRLLDALPQLQKVALPWQHEIVSTRRVINRLEGIAAQRNNQLDGLLIWSGEAHQAGILALAAKSAETGAALILKLRQILPEARFSYLNFPDDDPLLPVLEGAGFSESLSQYEMSLTL